MTTQMLEDVTTVQKPQAIIQFENFLKGAANPVSYLTTAHEALPTLFATVWKDEAVELIERVEMHLVQTAMADLDKAQEAYAMNDTKQVKPAELYRRYAKSLRAIKEGGVNEDTRMLAHETLTDLFLSQSLPASELEAPDYIDPYTGEVQEDDEFDFQISSIADIMAKFETVSPSQEELYQRAMQLKKELNWTQDTVNQFVAAQSSFDATESDDDWREDRGYIPPTGEQGLTVDRSAFVAAATPMAEFSHWRTETFEKMKNNGTNGQTWKVAFLAHKEDSAEVANLVNTIAEIANSYDVTTAAAIAMKVMGEYGLTEEDLDGIGGFTINGVFYELNDYIEEWGDDVLEIMQDGMPASIPTSDIDKMDQETQAQLAELLPEKHHNPMQTRSFILAYIQAISEGAELGAAENHAIAAWREAMNPAGAKAYQAAWEASRSKSVAWRAFWKKCGPDVPRPQDHIKAIRGNFSGLVLSSGRKIDWNITALKLKNDELAFQPGQKEKLKTLLVQRGLRNNPVLKYL
jgi:hypothetical protein